MTVVFYDYAIGLIKYKFVLAQKMQRVFNSVIWKDSFVTLNMGANTRIGDCGDRQSSHCFPLNKHFHLTAAGIFSLKSFYCCQGNGNCQATCQTSEGEFLSITHIICINSKVWKRWDSITRLYIYSWDKSDDLSS